MLVARFKERHGSNANESRTSEPRGHLSVNLLSASELQRTHDDLDPSCGTHWTRIEPLASNPYPPGMSARHMAMRSISRAHMTACKPVARARATYNASTPSSTSTEPSRLLRPGLQMLVARFKERHGSNANESRTSEPRGHLSVNLLSASELQRTHDDLDPSCGTHWTRIEPLASNPYPPGMSARHMAIRSISRAHMTACKAVARARATYNASTPSSGRHWTGCAHAEGRRMNHHWRPARSGAHSCAHLQPEDGASSAFKKARGTLCVHIALRWDRFRHVR